MVRLRGMLLGFFLVVLTFSFCPIGFDALRKLCEIKRKFDVVRYSAEIEIKETYLF